MLEVAVPAALIRLRCDGTNSWDGVKTKSGRTRQVRAGGPCRLERGGGKACLPGRAVPPEKRVTPAQQRIWPRSGKFAASAERRNTLRHMSSMPASNVVHCCPWPASRSIGNRWNGWKSPAGARRSRRRQANMTPEREPRGPDGRLVALDVQWCPLCSV